MAGITDSSEAQDGQGLDVKVDWVGFGTGERLWVLLASIWDGAPKSELRKLRLDREVRSRCLKFYSITL